MALKLSTQRRSDWEKQQQFSLSILSAISLNQVLANQVVEGGVNGVVFENFIYQLLRGLKDNPENQGKQIVLFLDNARIHKHPLVLETAARLGVHVLFNSQYSPWLNPVEQWYGYLKRKLRQSGKYQRR